MIMIFLFSAAPAEESSAESGIIVRMVLHILENVRGKAFTGEEFTYWAEVIHTPIRKLAHMTEYALLAWAFFVPTVMWGRKQLLPVSVGADGMPGNVRMNGKLLKKWYFGSLLAAVCYAVTDEIHQLFVEGRSGSAVDVLIDGAGAALGMLFFLLLWKIVRGIKGKKT